MQEVAFTLANAIAYVEAARAAGLDVNRLGQRLSFFFAAHNDFIEEVAKFRAARRLWAHLMTRPVRGDRPAGAAAAVSHADRRQSPWRPSNRTTTSSASRSRRSPRSWAARSRCIATAATRRWRCRPKMRRGLPCGPSRSSPSESGVANTVDPFGGAWAVEQRTDEIERDARALIEAIDAAGGTLAAIESGRIQRQIQDAAYAAQQAIDSGETVIVGVNRYVTDEASVDSSCSESIRRANGGRRSACERCVKAAMRRPGGAHWTLSSALRGTARISCRPSSPPSRRARPSARSADALRRVFGEHREIST